MSTLTTLLTVSYKKMFLPYFCVKHRGLHKIVIDHSKVPKIKECDLSEQFVRGSGPGGSAVNKNSNCVVLKHEPTGIVVRSHMSRCLDENRKIARKLLVDKLDALMNGDNSVAAQKRVILEKKYIKSESKKRKIAKVKSDWKIREGLEP